MTTAVASPPSFQSLSRLSWNGSSNSSGGFSAMSSDEVSRMFMPQRKVVSRSASSSSLASNSSSTSTSTVTPTTESTQGEPVGQAAKKKQRGGFWPVSKAESTSGLSNARANGAVQPTNSNGVNPLNNKSQLQSSTSNQNAGTTNGVRSVNGTSSTETSALLVLLPMNGTFERKQIIVPFLPDMLRIGRQTNAKTVPTPVNGFFDSKVLSRQHAEIWAERNGKVWIRDVKSSNGTFVNGQRLSPENRESEPHELRQHDSLELGIDIVSEDQKTIVHHKVSAKVEFAGLPGNSNNVLDLNFGDLDPSHGNSLLSSPMSAPMAHSRSQPGRPPNGRSSTAVSLAGSHANSMAQQRQANYWGTPLNVEQLVKQLSTEMRAARQQAQDLDHASNFLSSMIPSDGSNKVQVPKESSQQGRLSNGRVKPPRVDQAARFAEPPAPPPQQPLPEKPDNVKSGSGPLSLTNILKRSDTAKPPTNGATTSPISPQSSQILSLVEALSVAKKELDSQGARVKQLEEMLKQEKAAREAAEERTKRLEEISAARPVVEIEETTPSADNDISSDQVSVLVEDQQPVQADHLLEQRLESLMEEMRRMKQEMEQVTKRAETAESDASNTRASLAEMIDQLKKENAVDEPLTLVPSHQSIPGPSVTRKLSSSEREGTNTIKPSGQTNGHVYAGKLPEHLERAVATVLRENSRSGEISAQTAPYVSMLGVVLIGVGLMAYLNSWQKADK